jgi:hypothetical protein
MPVKDIKRYRAACYEVFHLVGACAAAFSAGKLGTTSVAGCRCDDPSPQGFH